MARTKQVPIRRESSSEYFNKETATWENAAVKKGTNGGAEKEKVSLAQAPEAGVVQLIIAVAGIYASL